ncbi:MAG: sensor histidine kinase [Peptoniphilaceae bacterium]
MEIAILIVALTLFVMATLIFIYNRNQVKKMIKTLDKMLDSAIDGSFSETIYDESMLSALELKLNRYISSNAVSSKKLLRDKDKINSLISDISHQTKTPIANLVLYSSLLSEREDLPKEVEELIKQIFIQSEKLNFLISGLIKTSRLETGIISVIPKHNSVKRMLRDVILQVKPLAEAKNIKISLICEEQQALFDFKWTSEAIYNIMDNSVKYTADEGEIQIEVLSYEMFCRIDVKDSGIGIKEEEINKIFKRFYRSSSVQDSQGVGIGLYLAREIISTQGGYIKVKSDVGKGSTFSIFLAK